MTNGGFNSIEEIGEIPRRVWNDFIENDGINRIENFRFLAPIKSGWLDDPNAQEIVDRQRQDFKRLIIGLFPPHAVSKFITCRLACNNFPNLTRYDMNEKFADVLRTKIDLRAQLPISPFDLDTNRKKFKQFGYFGERELEFAINLLRARPAIALSVLFFRRFLVEYAIFVKHECERSYCGEKKPSIDFFCDSWNQNTFIQIIYPAISIHLKNRTSYDEFSVGETHFNSATMEHVMNWLTINHMFWGKANKEQHGHDSKISCAAAGFITELVGKKGLLISVFEKIIQMSDDPLMANDLNRVVFHGTKIHGQKFGR